MSTTWTAGVVKHGDDPVEPSPGSVAVVTLDHYKDGEFMGTCTNEWHGYTATDVIAEKVRIFRGNRSDHDYVGLRVTRYMADGRMDVYTAGDKP